MHDDTPPPVHLPNAMIDAVLDGELRELLSTCFRAEKFARQRFNHVMPAQRWIVRIGGQLAAHLATHDFVATVAHAKHRAMGVAEVCVHPDHRGRGLVGRLLAAAESFHRDLPWAVLMGMEQVYSRYGYRKVDNVVLERLGPEPRGDCMGKCLAADVWPAESILLDCRDF